MNTASLDLCKELYKLTPDWFDTFAKYYLIDGALSIRPSIKVGDDWPGHVLEVVAPAYDLGYSMRRLPECSKVWLCNEQWIAEGCCGENVTSVVADTPENAAARLCIELIKQGVLTQDTGEKPKVAAQGPVNRRDVSEQLWDEFCDETLGPKDDEHFDKWLNDYRGLK